MSSAVEARIAEFLAEYEPAIQGQLQQAREILRARFPRGFELVFNTYNALVFGFSPSERSSQSFISVAGYPRWVTLFFLHGASLSDPSRLLEGAGKQVRGIRLESAAAINTPQVQALIIQAVEPFSAQLEVAPELSTHIKAVAAKRRPRRLAPAARRPSRTARAAHTEA